MKAVSAVVVTWDSAEYLPGCLRALTEATRVAGIDLELLVVDNASTDSSARIARTYGAHVIANEVNAGFAIAASQGVAIARSEWTFLLNPDIEVHRDFFLHVCSAGDASPADVGVLVPRVVFASDRTTVQHVGIAVDSDGIAHELAPDCSDLPVEPFGASGGAGIVRTRLFSEIGGFEPVFFAYLEDADFAWRVRAAGYSACYVPDAVAFHGVSASVNEGSVEKAYLVARNRRLLMRLAGEPSARSWLRRNVVDLLHCAYVIAQTRSVAPIGGRVAAIRQRSYLRFLAGARQEAGLERTSVSFLQPRPLVASLRAKRRMSRLAIRSGDHSGRRALPDVPPTRAR